MQILKRSLAAALLTLAATAAHAQPKAPDFSGQWEMNVAKSDLGPAAGMISKIAFTVTQTPASLKFLQAVSTVQGDQSNTQDLTLDGKAVTQTGPMGPMTTSASFAGDTLVIAGKAQVQGTEIGQISRWTLSPDGKTLTVAQESSTPMGAMTLKLVFDKK